MRTETAASRTWPEIPLSELGTLIRGRGGSKADAVDSGIPCIRYGDLYTHHDEVVREVRSFVPAARASAYTALELGDVVFAASGETPEEIGKAAAFCGPLPAVTSGDTIVFRPGRRVDGRFLGYATNASAANRHKSRLGQGSSVFHISAAHIGAYLVPMPPLSEQHAIAAVLDAVDDAIRKTEQVIAKLQQVKQGLLHDLLTRGIDDNGELRDPGRHPEQFQDSPLGKIPKDWKSLAMCEGIDGIDAGWSPLCEETPPSVGDWGVLKVSAVSSGVFLASESKTLPKHLLPRTDIVVRDGDVVLTRANGVAELVGVTVEVTDSRSDRLMLSDKLLRLRPKKERVISPYLSLIMQSAMTRKQVMAIISGSSGQKNLSQEQVLSLKVLLPSVEEQAMISERIRDHSRRVLAEERNLKKLKSVKAGLAEDLLTGRVRTTSLPEVRP
jgi:type I restriction enzyme S subunit